MATVTLTPLYGSLDHWPGRIFEVWSPVTINTRTATNFTFKFPASGVDFPGYQIVITGTGFTYDGNEPLSGDVAQVQVKNGAGQVVLTISNIGTTSLANDLTLLYMDMFGAPGHQDNQGPGPSGMAAWSHLLSGNDTINGSAGGDGWSLPGTNVGNDVINMGAGDDWTSGGVGTDVLNGGDGYDWLHYQNSMYETGYAAIRGATINVETGIALDPWGFTDHFSEFEAFAGSAFNDRFYGSLTNRDNFQGGRGNDTIDGGDITFNGAVQTQDRKDFVSYEGDAWDGARRGINVDLETSFAGGSITGRIIDGFGNTDTVIDIERVQGTRFNDVFVGSRVDNVFLGGEGRDSYNGAGGSGDLIRFWAQFGNVAPVGVRVDLSLAANQIINDGFGNVETAVSIEQLEGSGNADWFRGNALANYLEGGRGADTMAGGAGADTFYWDARESLVGVDRITDFAASGAAQDHLAFNVDGFVGMTTTVHLVNGTAATSAVGTFIYNAVNDTLYWDDDGTGTHAKVAVAVLVNVAALSVDDLQLWS